MKRTASRVIAARPANFMVSTISQVFAAEVCSPSRNSLQSGRWQSIANLGYVSVKNIFGLGNDGSRAAVGVAKEREEISCSPFCWWSRFTVERDCIGFMG